MNPRQALAQKVPICFLVEGSDIDHRLDQATRCKHEGCNSLDLRLRYRDRK